MALLILSCGEVISFIFFDFGFGFNRQLGMQNKIIELTNQKRYSEAFSYYQSLKRDIGYKIAPYVTV